MPTSGEHEAADNTPAVDVEPMASNGGRGVASDSSPEQSGPEEGLSIPSIDEPQRDRIVILGRRGAGKTIYLSRLYEQLWRSNDSLRMRAVAGNTHQACMDVIDQMQSGRWPPSTLGTLYQEIEVTYRREKSLLVALDYPGEVFRKAFVEDSETEDAQELLEHVDRAAGVILLLDPAVIQSGKMDETIDDEFGMVQAVRRIREWTGGESVPIALVLTKCDRHKHLIRGEGGLRQFIAKRYAPLLREVGTLRFFASAAVQAKPGDNGEQLPNLGRKPIGVIEPLTYCLEHVQKEERRRREEREAKERMDAYVAKTQGQQQAQRRTILFWATFWSSAIVLLAVIGLVTWILVSREPLP